MKEQNALEVLLYPSLVEQTKETSQTHLFERGMFISINNHKTSSGELWRQYKVQYQTIVKCLKGYNPSKDEVKVLTGRLPSEKVIMDLVAKKELLVVAGIHDYKSQDNRGRGSRRNYEYQHTHFYVYGSHNFLPQSNPELDKKIEHLSKMLHRHTHTTNRKHRLIKIQPVGTGKYKFTDDVRPTNLYKYLSLPYDDITKDGIINYIARNKNNPSNKYPLTYLYM